MTVPSRFLPALALLFLGSGCGETLPESDPADGTAGTFPPPEVAEAIGDDTPDWLVRLLHSDPTAEPQALSLFGEPLYAQLDESGEVAEQDLVLLEDPSDVERLIASGRIRRNHWQYREEMAFYTQALQIAPDDWRLPRFRGHRFLSVREFEAGIQDLERARELAPMNWDVAYHLGLAYFLAGRFGDAADEYLRCLDLAEDPEARAASAPGFRSCSENADDPESLVAMAEWAVRALQRVGRDAEAQVLVERIPDDLDIQENIAYYHNLLLDQGGKTEDELLSPGPDAPYRLETVGFGVANRQLARGDTTTARELLERLVEDPWWPGFGRLAAEVELARLQGLTR
jgi:tetratricopeptide (TPR) repeat protein